MTHYSLRILIAISAIALLTAGLVRWAPRPVGITVVDQSPNFGDIPTTTAITMTFSREPDRRSAERAFAIHPPVKGRFEWRERTLVFVPSAPLPAKTTYRVFMRPGLQDVRNRANPNSYVQWLFTTR